MLIGPNAPLVFERGMVTSVGSQMHSLACETLQGGRVLENTMYGVPCLYSMECHTNSVWNAIPIQYGMRYPCGQG